MVRLPKTQFPKLTQLQSVPFGSDSRLVKTQFRRKARCQYAFRESREAGRSHLAHSMTDAPPNRREKSATDKIVAVMHMQRCQHGYERVGQNSDLKNWRYLSVH